METGNGSTTSDSNNSPTPDPAANMDGRDLADFLKRSARLRLGTAATALQAQRAGLDWEQRAVERDSRAAHRALYGQHAHDGDDQAGEMGDLFLGDLYLGGPPASQPTPQPNPPEPTSQPTRSSNLVAMAGVAGVAGLLGAAGATLANRAETPPVVLPPAPIVRPVDSDTDTRNVLRFDNGDQTTNAGR